MANGRNDAVEMEEDSYREQCGNVILDIAAKLVAAGDMGRDDAIRAGVEWLRASRAADDDVTGTLAANLVFPAPSKEAPAEQVHQIKQELSDKAHEAAEDV